MWGEGGPPQRHRAVAGCGRGLAAVRWLGVGGNPAQPAAHARPARPPPPQSSRSPAAPRSSTSWRSRAVGGAGRGGRCRAPLGGPGGCTRCQSPTPTRPPHSPPTPQACSTWIACSTPRWCIPTTTVRFPPAPPMPPPPLWGRHVGRARAAPGRPHLPPPPSHPQASSPAPTALTTTRWTSWC